MVIDIFISLITGYQKDDTQMPEASPDKTISNLSSDIQRIRL